MSNYLSPEQARRHYGLETRDTEPLSDFEQALRQTGIASIEIPLTDSDFQRFSQEFAVCIDECPELLKTTLQTIDTRYGSEVGYVRKEKKVNKSTRKQIDDPKNYFHFNEAVQQEWQDRFRTGPKILRDFIRDGFQIQDSLVTVAKKAVAELEAIHPNISRLYFPQGTHGTYLRLVRYDGYVPDQSLGEVAKPHYDISDMTIQVYADTSGFWGAHESEDGIRQHYDTTDGQAYAFMGKGHEKVYGRDDPLRPLWHGVDRVIPAGALWVPERTAVILFVDAPEVDHQMSREDTLPYVGQHMARRALAGV